MVNICGKSIIDRNYNSMERPPHPSIFKKIKKTKNLIKKGVKPEDLESKGGLDIDTYKNLKLRNEVYNELIEATNARKSEINTSVRQPCKKSPKVTGNRNALTLPIDFSDVKHEANAEHFQDMLFTKGSHSMRDYYLEVSWDQLDIDGDVLNWVTAKNPREYYVDKLPAKNEGSGGIYFPKAQELIGEAVKNAIKEDLDFSKYDYNDDGIIDMLVVIFAGVGFDTALKTSYITAHTGYLNDPFVFKKDGKEYQIHKYSLVPELSSGNLKPDDLGCFCHEMAHVLGIPELYHLDFSSDSPQFAPVLGDWCLMGVGSFVNNGQDPTHLDPWCKIKLGWVEPEVVTGKPADYMIPGIIDKAKKIYKLEVPKTKGKEYFLVENRRKEGFDKDIPAEGLLVWHVDENQCIGDFPNSDPKHYFLSVVQADGADQLEELKNFDKLHINGDSGDVFPGSKNIRNFDNKSNPSSNSYNRKDSGINILSISDPTDIMSANMGFKPIK
jgi:immune inhibitor A